jgi:hypothetical protein
LSTFTRSLAASRTDWPGVWPIVMRTLPPGIRSLKTGSEATSSSSMIAILRPMFSPDIASKRSAPTRSSLRLTSGIVPVWLSKPTLADTMLSPVTSARDLTT